jgi:hypothetical protein
MAGPATPARRKGAIANEHLTEEQKRIQETAVYGLPQQQRPLGLNNLTHEQIELLRGVLFQHDAQNAAMTRERDARKPRVETGTLHGPSNSSSPHFRRQDDKSIQHAKRKLELPSPVIYPLCGLAHFNVNAENT